LSTKPKDQDKAKSARPTNKSDVYSLAMVAIEVMISSLVQYSVSQPSGHLQIFTGDYPFDSRSDEQVIVLLADDKRPDRPVHEQFTSRMWSLTKRCWRKDPKKRPDIPEVVEKLESKDGAFSFSREGFWPLLKKHTGRKWYSSIQGSLSALGIGLQFGDRSSIIHAEG
jgi:serine/threonine protein kinase